MSSCIYFKFDNLYRQPWQAFMKVLFWSWKDTMECCMLLGLSVESTLKSSCCPMPLDWFNNFTPLGTTIMDFRPPSVWYLLQWKNVHQLMASHFHAFPWPTLQFSTLLYHLRTSFENYKNILYEIYNFLISIRITNLFDHLQKRNQVAPFILFYFFLNSKFFWQMHGKESWTWKYIKKVFLKLWVTYALARKYRHNSVMQMPGNVIKFSFKRTLLLIKCCWCDNVLSKRIRDSL